MVFMPAVVASQGGGAVLDGVLERVTFANPETGYTIARIAPERGGAELITAVGPLLGAQIGEFLRLRGRWSSHPKYGRQFEVASYATVLPATAAGIQKYLGSGLIKGIGPVMAERMVTHFGTDIMHVIDDEPGRLIEVDGLGPKRTAMIAAAWAEQKAIKEVMIFLQGVGVSTSLAVRIYKKYGDASVSVVRSEPYRLAADVWGIGFKTADTIARSVGIAPDSPERIKAGLAYTLSEAADDGHCYLPAPNLITDAAKILDVPADLIVPCLDELAAAEGVVREQVPAAARPAPAEAAPQVPAVYLPPFYQAERSLARALLRLHAARADRLAGFAAVDWDKALGWLRGRTGSELAPEQADAVRLALTAKVAVLTGGPGCGKSFTVRSVVELARAKGATIVLAAPTGRAAKRLAELAGHDAATIHRLLQLRPGGDPSFDADKPLDADLVVVDETSMVDVILANKLVKAVPPGAHLLLVGDVDQLPSVGAGEVLRDLLRCRVAARGTADQDLPPGPAVRHRGQRPPGQRRAAAAADRVRRLLLVRLRRHRADRRTCRGHRGAADPGPVRPGPAPRHPGALPDAPRPGRRREPQPAAARGPDTRPATARRNAATVAGCSGSATRSPSCATTTTRAPPASSTAPSASSPPCHPKNTP